MSASKVPETYELLVSLLAKCPQSIEILPGDGTVWMHAQSPPGDTESQPPFSPFLFVEGNLGIPQKILWRVYLHAVGVFKSVRSCISTLSTAAVKWNPDLDASLVRILAASSVIVLANPSHQTALNARKYLVWVDLINPHAELRFMASLLSSQHCAKHAELWYHRRWLLSYACDTRSQSPNTAGVDSHCRLRFASRDAFCKELELASRACELYPRNYFAWTHRLMCMRSLLTDYLTGVDVVDFVSIFRNEIAGVKGWIDCHVSDYSAIHTIVALSEVAFQGGDSSLLEAVVEEDLLDHAISLVREYPTHEALWMYVRIALSIPGLWQAQKIQQFVENFVQPLVHLPDSNTGMDEDIAKVSRCATQFLEGRVGLKLS